MINRGILLLILLVCCSFQSNELKDLLVALQNNIQKSIRISPEANPAKTKLEVNQAGFIRFTQTLKSGKQNYASLNLYKFSKMNYWGTAQVGTLILYSVKNEVIVQTFNDRQGMLIPCQPIWIFQFKTSNRNNWMRWTINCAGSGFYYYKKVNNYKLYALAVISTISSTSIPVLFYLFKINF